MIRFIPTTASWKAPKSNADPCTPVEIQPAIVWPLLAPVAFNDFPFLKRNTLISFKYGEPGCISSGSIAFFKFICELKCILSFWCAMVDIDHADPYALNPCW